MEVSVASYTDEQRQELVERFETIKGEGKSAQEAAKELGVAYGSISSWARKSRRADGVDGDRKSFTLTKGEIEVEIRMPASPMAAMTKSQMIEALTQDEFTRKIIRAALAASRASSKRVKD